MYQGRRTSRHRLANEPTSQPVAATAAFAAKVAVAATAAFAASRPWVSDEYQSAVHCQTLPTGSKNSRCTLSSSGLRAKCSKSVASISCR